MNTREEAAKKYAVDKTSTMKIAQLLEEAFKAGCDFIAPSFEKITAHSLASTEAFDEELNALRARITRLESLLQQTSVPKGMATDEELELGPCESDDCTECRGLRRAIFERSEKERLTDHADLMCDEFQRIGARLRCNETQTVYTEELLGLCDRAVTQTKQRVPVIIQRDNAIRERDTLRAELEKERERADRACEVLAKDAGLQRLLKELKQMEQALVHGDWNSDCNCECCKFVRGDK